MSAQVDDRFHGQVLVGDRTKRGERRQVDSCDLESGSLDRIDGDQYRMAWCRDQQPAHHVGLRIRGTELRVVEEHLVHRQRDNLASLEGQRFRPLLRIYVRHLHVAHQHLRVGDAEDDVAAVEVVDGPQLLDGGGQRVLVADHAVDDRAGREGHSAEAVHGDRRPALESAGCQDGRPYRRRADVESDRMAVGLMTPTLPRPT